MPAKRMYYLRRLRGQAAQSPVSPTAQGWAFIAPAEQKPAEQPGLSPEVDSAEPMPIAETEGLA